MLAFLLPPILFVALATHQCREQSRRSQRPSHRRPRLLRSWGSAVHLSASSSSVATSRRASTPTSSRTSLPWLFPARAPGSRPPSAVAVTLASHSSAPIRGRGSPPAPAFGSGRTRTPRALTAPSSRASRARRVSGRAGEALPMSEGAWNVLCYAILAAAVVVELYLLTKLGG